ncbi:TetR/AcrR family transcriptional regulator [Radiobacillus sp. PE A8.2]|uniref:TetR/AcrR family transcriptional regulator n=1 Tax=Radiobacillus sp. PE A8.2 TaxID=3380349 RepID=UPI003890358A
MAPRKAVDRELSKEMIMEAARDLFAKKGYQHVSMRQIAQELKYSHGAIYYHFKNKAALFYAMVEDHFQILNEILDSIMEQHLYDREKLHQIMLGFIEFGLTHQSHYEIMFLIKDEEVQFYLSEGPNKSYQKFAQSLFILSGKKMSLQDIWSVFLSLHGFVTHYCRTVNNYSEVRGIAEAHVKFLLKGIEPIS